MRNITNIQLIGTCVLLCVFLSKDRFYSYKIYTLFSNIVSQFFLCLISTLRRDSSFGLRILQQRRAIHSGLIVQNYSAYYIHTQRTDSCTADIIRFNIYSLWASLYCIQSEYNLARVYMLCGTRSPSSSICFVSGLQCFASFLLVTAILPCTNIHKIEISSKTQNRP